MRRKMRKLSKTGPEPLRAAAKQLIEIWMKLVKDAPPEIAKRCEPTNVPLKTSPLASFSVLPFPSHMVDL